LNVAVALEEEKGTTRRPKTTDVAQDLLLPEFIYPRLKSHRLGKTIHHFLETGSTNDAARQLADQGAPEGTLVLAEEQTQGRGRLGRAWLSERGAGIYASILLRPVLKPRDVAVLTLVAAVAASEAIELDCGLRADIKWPNDLLLSGRKCCGILSEMQAERDDVRYVIVGIGINVNHSVFPEELSQRATSLRIEGKRTYSRVALLCEFLLRFELLYDDLQRGSLATVLQRWVDRSSFAFGKQVSVDLSSGKMVDGQTVGLSALGNLKVKLADGRVEEVMSGDIVAWR
jgi:BirA family transcriptional regulator, biotin operon repressor / biotin---[acetyl-CoA-carboxylase] ligase